MKSSRLILCLVLWLVKSVLCGWISPPPNTGRMDYANNNVYLVGSTINLEWNVTLPSYSLWLWHQNLTVDVAAHKDPIYVKDASAAETGGITWTVTPQTYNLSVSNVFFLYLGVNETLQGSGRGFVSHYLNLTTDPSLVNTSPSASQSGSRSPTSSPTDHPAGSSDATKIGLGVGLGIGIPLLIIVSAVFFVMIRRKHNQQKDISNTVVEKPELPAQPIHQMPVTDKHELPTRGAELVELPENARR